MCLLMIGVAACGSVPTPTPWPTADLGVDGDAHAVRLDPAASTPTVLIFWATWCGHCKALLADVDRWRATRRFELVAVNIGEPVERVRQLMARQSIPGRVVFDLDGVAAAAYDATPVPTALVVADGRVFGRIRGRSRDNRITLRGALDAAIAWLADRPSG